MREGPPLSPVDRREEEKLPALSIGYRSEFLA